MMRVRLFLFHLPLCIGISGAALISGCTGTAPEVPLPTIQPHEPDETAVADQPESPTASPTTGPMSASTTAIVIEPELPAPTDTPGYPPVGVPLEELSILSPGPGSQVIDPIQLGGFGGPSHLDRVQVRLYGEDGRLVTQGWSYLYVLPGNAGNFYASLPFKTSLVGERGWLEVRSFGDRYGELRHLTTQEILLLSTGNPRIFPAMRGAEKITIFHPQEEAIIEGGTVIVIGAGWVDVDRPLTIQIIDSSGDVLASSDVPVDSPGPGQLGPFQATLEYEIPYPRWARVAVFERGDAVPEIIHYSSVEVWLRP